jgi:hypothetical protein
MSTNLPDDVGDCDCEEESVVETAEIEGDEGTGSVTRRGVLGVVGGGVWGVVEGRGRDDDAYGDWVEVGVAVEEIGDCDVSFVELGDIRFEGFLTGVT